jgi:nucleotide-binding universal stress UspA family protein/pimeloyl-ACP methyl ester carboxylesterase
LLGNVVMLTFRTILHPTDLSEAAIPAFRIACALARDYSARLVVLSVYPPPLTSAEGVDLSRPGNALDDLMAQLQQLKPVPEVPIEYQVAEGHPAEQILAVAQSINADLIVMGTHGRTGLRRVFMGSVAEVVNRKANCPVMTVRPTIQVPLPPAKESDQLAWPEPDPNLDLGVGDPSREVRIPMGRITLPGTLQWAGQPRGVVVFAHGSGSSRHSPRNRFVANVLVEAGFATLLMDLLTEAEAGDQEKVFDIELLAHRLAGAAEWVAQQAETTGLPIGYFGASTGSAAAFVAAARHPERVQAVVSRGGRPDLAWDDLPAVVAPTLLIVGSDDEPVLSWNREALQQLNGPKHLAIVAGATHLFEEPGTLEQVAQLAREWFVQHLLAQPPTLTGRGPR